MVEAHAADLRLGGYLREHRDALLAAWELEVSALPKAASLDRPRLIDHLPELLDRLAACAEEIDREAETQLPEQLPDLHALSRLEVGYDLRDVVQEYALLRKVVLQHLGAAVRRLPPVHHLLFHAVIDHAIGRAVERYASAREMALREMRHELGRRAAELAAIIEAIPEALYVGDMSGIKRANRVALEQLGFETMEELNRGVAELGERIQTRDARTGVRLAPTEEPFARALLRGEVVVQEVRVRHLKTGEDRVVRCSAAPVTLDGEVFAAVAVNTDVTEAVRREEALHTTAAFREQFIGILGHDLRSPLTAIKMSAATLARFIPDSPPARRNLDRISTTADRMSRMINDVLDFTRGRLGGGIPVQPREVDLADVAGDLLNELRAAHPDRQMELVVEGDTRGRWDPDRASQALGNLVGNAITHGSPEAPLRLTVRGGEREVAVEVWNEGPPIPQDVRARIFEPFVQPGRRGTSAGLGLGLFIVCQIVQAHGGRVSVRSEAGEGTTFTTCWPREGNAR